MMNGVESNGNVYAPLSTAVTNCCVVPMCKFGFGDNSVQGKYTAVKSDSGLTFAAVPVSRKRSRDEITPPLLSSFPGVVPAQNQNLDSVFSSFSLPGYDFSFQMLQQEIEIDRFISQHTDKFRMEMEEKRRRYFLRIAAAVEESVTKKVRARDEEIEKMRKLHWTLEEKVKSLCAENQIWKDLAHSNEAKAEALRFNLQQVEYELNQHQLLRCSVDAAVVDDAQSCCGGKYEDETDSTKSLLKKKIGGNSDDKMCRNCGNMESCVLLLPCRHLCLCNFCGSSLSSCPLCYSIKTATLQVNLS